jgi:hypothetical protein
MSRTFRKNSRWYCWYQGKLVNNYKKCRSDHTPNTATNDFEDDWLTLCDSAQVRKEIDVGDADNLKSLRLTKKDKQKFRRIDRSRQRNALRRSLEDDNVTPDDYKPAFDPLDWS